MIDNLKIKLIQLLKIKFYKNYQKILQNKYLMKNKKIQAIKAHLGLNKRINKISNLYLIQIHKN